MSTGSMKGWELSWSLTTCSRSLALITQDYNKQQKQLLAAEQGLTTDPREVQSTLDPRHVKLGTCIVTRCKFASKPEVARDKHGRGHKTLGRENCGLK